MKSEKNKTKKSKQVKNKRSQKKALDSVFEIYKNKRQKHMFYVWPNSDWKWITRRAFYSKIGGGIKSLFQRAKRNGPVLQLQHKPRRKSVCLRPKTGTRKGQSVVSLKKNFGKMVGGEVF